MHSISALANRHYGETCYIIGKGPSLKNLRWLPPGPIIALNESIKYVENLPGVIYSMQQDGKPQCMVLPDYATLLLSTRSASWFPDYSPSYVYDQVKDLGVMNKIISAVSAIEVARLMGCKRLVFVAFDACTSDDASYPDDLWMDPANSLTRFRRFFDIIRLSLKGLDATFLTPDGKSLGFKTAPYTAITLTGDRHVPFKLCKKWLLRQTVLPSQGTGFKSSLTVQILSVLRVKPTA